MNCSWFSCSSTTPSSSSNRNGGTELTCPHADGVSSSRFKRLLCDYLDAVKDSESKGKKKPRNMMVCQECSSTEDLWICINCSAILCMRDADEGRTHALTHWQRRSGDCHLFLSCVDSHIFCCTCGQYLYPREIAQVGISISLKDKIGGSK